MKMIGLISLAAAIALAAPARALSLEGAFHSPPDSARPHVYYMIMNGNMSKECITADFEAMAKVGIGGVLVLDVGCFIPAGPVVFASPEWFDIMLHLHKEAKRLGIEVTLPNCAGWASAGGPWVTPEHAMKTTVFTETPAKGSRHFSGVLPRTKKDNGFYADIAVLAYPTLKKGASLTELNAKIGLDRKNFKRDSSATDGTKPVPPTMIAKDRIVDLTAKMSPDGRLEWDVPAGDWTILRIGYACNGRRNVEAANGGRGLEVDKLSAAAMDVLFEGLVGRLCRHLGVSAATDNSTGFNAAHIDSHEVGCQNWTQGLDRTFKERMGYSITPYLPVFAGRIVGSVDESERFLEDFRRLLADLFAENYEGRFTELCHKYGLKSSLEPYGNSNADNLQYGQSADVPMNEFWSCVRYGGAHHVGGTGNTIAASLAHVWGRRYAGAEAFTARPNLGGRWLTTPFSIKAQGDRAYAAGVNRIVYHRYACQPWAGDKCLPGMTMGRWGIHLERTQTWWPLAADWFRYQSRCQWMLQEGRFTADILYWCGEDAPNNSQPKVKIPKGYKHDFCATRAVELLKVRNGKVVVPGGVEYAVLVLPQGDTMSETMVRRVGELLEAGAKVVAQGRPVRAPGMLGKLGETASVQQQEYQALVESVWAKGVMECGIEEALTRLGVESDFSTDAPDVSWIHRKGVNGQDARCPSEDWYFVTQDNEFDSTFEASFRVSGRTPEIWDALTGEIRPADVWREEGGRTIVTFKFPPSGSAFVVFRDRKSGKHLVKADVAVAKPMNQKEESVQKHTLVIKKAEYGLFPGMPCPSGKPNPGWRLDVTKTVAGYVTNGTINLNVGIGLFKKDPIFGFHKITRIEYEYDGVANRVDVGEGGLLRIPACVEIPAPEWEWRDGKVLAWKPLTAKLRGSDGTVRSVSANPPEAVEVTGDWDVSFPQGWDAPARAVFPKLVPWNESRDWGIKYFSGTAVYRKRVALGNGKRGTGNGERVMLDLGEVKDFAEVTVNGKKFPVLWKPPFCVDITDAVMAGRAACPQAAVRRVEDNAPYQIDIEIKVTNLWPNRLIGDEALCKADREWVGSVEYVVKEIPQWVKDGKPSPTGRRTFTTWRHWTKDDALLPSGLIGPVVIRFGETAKSTESGWRVAELNGAPGLWHDGKPVPAMMFWQWEPQEKDTRDLSAAGMDIFAMFGSFPHYKNPYWRKDGSFGMAYQDSHIDNLLSWAPKAAFLPRIFYTAPDWWSVAHPDERHVFATPRKGTPARESFASLKCREELSPYYRKAVRHLIDRYGDRLMGIHVANGPCGEHFSWDVMLGGANSSGSSWGDLSEPMRQAFIRYLRRKYGNDVARLREAFKDPKADFESVTLPGKDERSASDFGWRYPAKGRRVIDYLECCNETTAEMIDHYCGIVKDESKGTLPTLAFYGYVADDEWVCENDHRGISKMYLSKNLDMLSAPHTYRRRKLGEDGMQRQYLASAALHGKFFIDEGDDMTHLEKLKKRPDRRCTVNTMEESLALLYREFGMTVTHGTGLWYMDLTRGTFRDPKLVDAVGRMRKWAEVALKHDRSHHSEVAVVSQPQSGFYTGRGGKFVGTVTQQLYVKQMGEFYRAGAPFDWYLAEDLDAVVKGKAKVVAFLDCQYLSDEQYALALKLKEQGRKLVFFHAPAYASQTALSWDRVKRLTGGETYETLKLKSADELRGIYKDAGVHVYTDSDVVLSANSAWLMLHTREAGDYKIALPRKVRKVTEITTEKVIAENADGFTLNLPKHATAVFLLEPMPSAAIKSAAESSCVSCIRAWSCRCG